jgi:hypothetical protein
LANIGSIKNRRAALRKMVLENSTIIEMVLLLLAGLFIWLLPPPPPSLLLSATPPLAGGGADIKAMPSFLLLLGCDLQRATLAKNPIPGNTLEQLRSEKVDQTLLSPFVAPELAPAQNHNGTTQLWSLTLAADLTPA